MQQEDIFSLDGKIQNYAWGGDTFLAGLLHVANPTHQPMAEYWMGAHPNASSEIVVNGEKKSLFQLIQTTPERYVGEKVWQAFGELSFLFKILDVREMLSIQVHPSKSEAAKGFDAEENAGIPISAPNRNYKDRNHKPEMMIALSEFWLLHGFMSIDKIQARLEEVPEFESLQSYFTQKNIKSLYQYIMELPQEEADIILSPLVKRELENKAKGLLDKHQPGWWVAKLYADGMPTSQFDKGIFSIYLFNIVKIEKGDGIFQGAGLPHAYLEGQNVELMANSDNVLRGGLTPKHIDVPELLKHTLFEGIEPNILRGGKDGNTQTYFDCPVVDFGMAVVNLSGEQTLENKTTSLEIIFVLEGILHVSSVNTSAQFVSGQAFAILPDTNYKLSTGKNVIAYRAFIPAL